MIPKVNDPQNILQDWLRLMSDQSSDVLEKLMKDSDSDSGNDDDGDTTDEDGDTTDEVLKDVNSEVESIEFVHVDQEYNEEDLYTGMSSGIKIIFYSLLSAFLYILLIWLLAYKNKEGRSTNHSTFYGCQSLIILVHTLGDVGLSVCIFD